MFKILASLKDCRLMSKGMKLRLHESTSLAGGSHMVIIIPRPFHRPIFLSPCTNHTVKPYFQEIYTLLKIINRHKYIVTH